MQWGASTEVKCHGKTHVGGPLKADGGVGEGLSEVAVAELSPEM